MSDINVFIDTSTFLTFYAYTSDNLEELKKIVALIKAKKIKLYIPTQVSDEFQRNRDGKLSQSLKDFMGGGVTKSIPRFMSHYPQVQEMLNAGKAYQQARENLFEAATKDAAGQMLPADALFSSIVDAAGLVEVGENILQKANRRRLRGNPPGKQDSIGDQINWEVLLSEVPNGKDLHIISKDGDYASDLNGDLPHRFLELEWKSKKGSKVFIHTQLRIFLNEHFADFKFAMDIEKSHALESLIYSGSFSTTHSAIENLSHYKDDLNWDEVKKIFDAGISNNQISWIGMDNDVNEFYRYLMDKFYENTSFEMDEKLEEVFPDLSKIEGDAGDVPF